MNQITIDAFAKVNLALDVRGRLPNGYHEVRMIMQQISLKDRVTVRRTGSGRQSIQVTCTNPDLPTDRSNLAWQAAELLLNLHEMLEGVEIHIEKNIPVEAGLAGGSTDCAAVLIAMNTLFDLKMSTAALCELGAKLGSDVPFCIQGGTAVARGTGTSLTPVKGLSSENYTVVLCKPPVGVSTGKVYAEFSERRGEMVGKPRPDIVTLVGDITMDAPIRTLKKNMINMLEYVTADHRPEIRSIETTMENNGADLAMMTGSGPTVFGIFRDREFAAKAYMELSEIYPETYITMFR